MSTMGNRSALRTRGAVLGGLLSAMLAATALVAGPAGASSQEVHFHVTPIYFGECHARHVHDGPGDRHEHLATGDLLHLGGAGHRCDRRGVPRLGGHLHRRRRSGRDLRPLGRVRSERAGAARLDAQLRFADHNAQGRRSPSPRPWPRGSRGAVQAHVHAHRRECGQRRLNSIGSASATITNTSIDPAQGLSVRTCRTWSTTTSSSPQNTCPNPVLPGGSCDLVFNFKPYRTGAASATLSVAMLLAGTPDTLVTRQATIRATA